jgi:hypothetical protein
MTKPDLWLKSGQFRAMEDLKRGSSVMTKKATDIVSQRNWRCCQVLHTADGDGDDVFAPIEEVEFADDERLDQHDRTRRDNCQQTDYVEDSNGVEDNVTGASQ